MCSEKTAGEVDRTDWLSSSEWYVRTGRYFTPYVEGSMLSPAVDSGPYERRARERGPEHQRIQGRRDVEIVALHELVIVLEDLGQLGTGELESNDYDLRAQLREVAAPIPECVLREQAFGFHRDDRARIPEELSEISRRVSDRVVRIKIARGDAHERDEQVAHRQRRHDSRSVPRSVPRRLPEYNRHDTRHYQEGRPHCRVRDRRPARPERQPRQSGRLQSQPPSAGDHGKDE